MLSLQIQIILIAMLTSLACVLPGVFLILRGVSLMSDAISHAILLGIIVMFLITHNLDSPLLIIGASFAGILTVICTEAIIHTRCLKKDAAIGLVFPLFFSVGVILISLYARNVHLDTDMVLLGELAFAPFNRLVVYGLDCGPWAMWTMAVILCINVLFIFLFYKELKLSTFDQDYAVVIGCYPTILYYGLMSITSITAVGAFDVVGSIVVVALMITPAAIGYLWTNVLSDMILVSVMSALACSVFGYFFAYYLDVSIAGGIATVTGIMFLGSLLAAPQKGIIGRALYKKKCNKALRKKLIQEYLQKQPKKHSHEEISKFFGWDVSSTKEIQ